MMRRIQAWTAILAIILSMTAACTQRTADVDLPRGQKLVVVTWKGENLWYLTRDMRRGEQPESYTFWESSSFGGVAIRESR